jgi:hypothetical protein
MLRLQMLELRRLTRLDVQLPRLLLLLLQMLQPG